MLPNKKPQKKTQNRKQVQRVKDADQHPKLLDSFHHLLLIEEGKYSNDILRSSVCWSLEKNHSRENGQMNASSLTRTLFPSSVRARRLSKCARWRTFC